MEEEDNVIVKWAQEDVETSYSLLNNNNIPWFVQKTLRIKRRHINTSVLSDVVSGSKV